MYCKCRLAHLLSWSSVDWCQKPPAHPAIMKNMSRLMSEGRSLAREEPSGKLLMRDEMRVA